MRDNDVTIAEPAAEPLAAWKTKVDGEAVAIVDWAVRQ